MADLAEQQLRAAVEAGIAAANTYTDTAKDWDGHARDIEFMRAGLAASDAAVAESVGEEVLTAAIAAGNEGARKYAATPQPKSHDGFHRAYLRAASPLLLAPVRAQLARAKAAPFGEQVRDWLQTREHAEECYCEGGDGGACWYHLSQDEQQAERLKSLADVLAPVRAENARLREQVAALSEAAALRDESLVALRQVNNAFRADLADVRGECATLRQQLAEAERQRDEMETRLKTARAAYDGLREAVEGEYDLRRAAEQRAEDAEAMLRQTVSKKSLLAPTVWQPIEDFLAATSQTEGAKP